MVLRMTAPSRRSRLLANTAQKVFHQVKQPLFIGFFFWLGAIEYFSYKPFHKHINPNNQCDWQHQNKQQKIAYTIDRFPEEAPVFVRSDISNFSVKF